MVAQVVTIPMTLFKKLKDFAAFNCKIVQEVVQKRCLLHCTASAGSRIYH